MDMLAGLALVMAFLLGTVPFGVVLSKAFGLPDPRSFGSGNIGATNMLRSGRKDIAAFTLVLDMLKGYVGVALVDWIDPTLTPIAFLLPVLGHIYSPWLNFKGGKGVATAFGVIFAISSVVGFLCAVLWILTFYALRISSLAALTALIFAPIIMWAHSGMLYATVTVLLTALIFHTHRANINRLVRGTEPKFEFKKKEEKPEEVSIEPPSDLKDPDV